MPAEVTARTPRPILDTHIHLYQVSRPGGVAWPEPQAKTLYRDVLPAEYKQVAQLNGIVGTGIVEASPLYDDNWEVLELTKADPFFKFVVARVEIGSKSFSAELDRLADDPRVVGIRGFLWSPQLTLDAQQLASVRELAERGMTLDIVSRANLNPKDKLDELATAVPNLRIIIDHLAGAKGKTVNPTWVAGMEKLAKHPNVHIKFSSFFDMFNPLATEYEPWTSPTELNAYDAHFDVLMKSFGEDRLIWGSNWPVVDLGGSVRQSIAIAEAYLQRFGQRVRDKVMYENAVSFYRRSIPR